jgi:hypothetical protein
MGLSPIKRFFRKTEKKIPENFYKNGFFNVFPKYTNTHFFEVYDHLNVPFLPGFRGSEN